jgi:hypothetical protein
VSGARPSGTGSRASTEPASRLGPPGFDPARIALAIERVGRVLVEVDFDCGHFITGDNLKIVDVQILHDLAKGGRK